MRSLKWGGGGGETLFKCSTVSTVPRITYSKINVKLHIIYGFENTVLGQQTLHITKSIV